MFNFYEKRKIRSLLYSKLTLGILSIILLFLTYSVFGVYQKERETVVKRDSRAAVLAELTGREQELSLEIDRLNSPRGIEEEIRDRYEVAKEGERVIVIVDAPKEEDDHVSVENHGFFDRILNFLGI